MSIYDDIEAYCTRKRYSDSLKRYWILHPKCEILGCSGYSQCPHHIKTRGAGGVDTPDNLLALCVGHHNMIHRFGWQSFANKATEHKKKIYEAMGRDV